MGPGAWAAWTSTCDRSWKTVYGQQHLHFAPLFGHQFNHCWVDYRGLKDAELLRLDPTGQLDYFENTRRATYAQQAYARANPEGWAGYDGTVFGVTASDGPADVVRGSAAGRGAISYAGRGLAEHDDGTLAPMAPAAPCPLRPRSSSRPRRHRERHPHTWGRYGFFDAFNPSFRSPTSSSSMAASSPAGLGRYRLPGHRPGPPAADGWPATRASWSGS